MTNGKETDEEDVFTNATDDSEDGEVEEDEYDDEVYYDCDDDIADLQTIRLIDNTLRIQLDVDPSESTSVDDKFTLSGSRK